MNFSRKGFRNKNLTFMRDEEYSISPNTDNAEKCNVQIRTVATYKDYPKLILLVFAGLFLIPWVLPYNQASVVLLIMLVILKGTADRSWGLYKERKYFFENGIPYFTAYSPVLLSEGNLEIENRV
eukprot:snap_masked-scaffold_26-processed-gene-1.26-mRNA-1 protein AED:1.00 eAED:1.00 QI:0/0/0/0/1/1/2/0/124